MPHPRFTPRQLAAFVAVAQARSFRKAGEQLSLSSSAVSQLVGDLELALELRLFDRTTRSVVLSPAGREFLPSATSVLKHMQLAQNAADDICNRASGVVRIAAPLIMASSVLPALIKEYTRTRPKLVIRIRDAPVDGLVDRVSNADADFAIGADQPVGDDIVRKDLFKSPWVLWCSANHPLAGYQSIPWSQLRHQPLVVAGRDYERTVALTHGGQFEQGRIIPVDIVENVSTALGIAAHGMAATLGPAYVGLLARLLGLTMRPIVQPEVTRQVCIYHSSTRAMSPAAQGFCEFLEEQLKGNDELGVGGVWRLR